MVDQYPTNICPGFSSTRSTSTQVNQAEFGDGYGQRSAAGINNIRDTWNLAYTWLTDVEATGLRTFLESKAGVEAFYWTPPGEAQKLFTSAQWSISPLEPGYKSATVTLKQEFDIV